MLRLPPSWALTVLAAMTAPIRLVSPALLKVTLTWVLVELVSCPLPCPEPLLALALKLGPPVGLMLAPMLELLELLLLA